MRFGLSELANVVGTHLVPFTNPRVVCPPGRVRAQGRPNIIIATPMRSGTHILIDLILNNLPAYRNRPLYVDLDQCAKQGTAENDLLGTISTDAGYLLKTHMPLNVPDTMLTDPRIEMLIAQGIVITVRRPRADVCRSLGRWHNLDTATAAERYGAQYDQFWDVWDGRAQITLEFGDLFAPDRISPILHRLGEETGTRAAAKYTAPPSGAHKYQIYGNKMLTRLLGRRTPRVDTTIHTLKS